MRLYTIGFTKRSAESFFSSLNTAGVSKLIDVRLNNVSQLAGFAKRRDLEFFLEEICAATYVHHRSLAPTQEMLDAYKKGSMPWGEYERLYLELLVQRGVERYFDSTTLDNSVLLCSEATPVRCHRRLAAEYLAHHFGGLEIQHL